MLRLTRQTVHFRMTGLLLWCRCSCSARVRPSPGKHAPHALNCSSCSSPTHQTASCTSWTAWHGARCLKSFLANKFAAAKRFGLEGCETLIPGHEGRSSTAAPTWASTPSSWACPHRGVCARTRRTSCLPQHLDAILNRKPAGVQGLFQRHSKIMSAHKMSIWVIRNLQILCRYLADLPAEAQVQLGEGESSVWDIQLISTTALRCARRQAERAGQRGAQAAAPDLQRVCGRRPGRRVQGVLRDGRCQVPPWGRPTTGPQPRASASTCRSWPTPPTWR